MAIDAGADFGDLSGPMPGGPGCIDVACASRPRVARGLTNPLIVLTPGVPGRHHAREAFKTGKGLR